MSHGVDYSISGSGGPVSGAITSVPELSPQELELAVLAAAISGPGSIRELMDLGVTARSFAMPEHQAAWELIATSTPSIEDVRLLTGVGLPLTEHGAIAALAEALNRRAVSRLVRHAVASYLPSLDVAPSETAAKLVSLISEAMSTKGGSTPRYADADAEQRLAELRERMAQVERGEVIGIPTGIPEFDTNGETWKDGDLVAVIGVTSVGKSTLTLSFAVEAYLQGHSVLWLSPENTREEVEHKWDPMVGRRMGYSFSNTALRNGRLENIADYEEYVQKIKGRRDWVSLDSGAAGVFTLDDIITLAGQHRPKVLVIDGFHLIKGLKQSWENMKDAAEAIKGLAQNQHMVTFATCQAGSGGREAYRLVDTAPEIWHVSYGQALGDASDRVLAIGARRGEETTRFINVRKNRGGRVPTRRIYMRFDPDAGIVEQHLVEETSW